MALIERFTPGGNLYPDGASTFAVLREIFEKIAKTRDTVDQRIIGNAESYARAQATAAAQSAKETATTSAKVYTDQQAAAAQSAAVTTANGYTDAQVAAVEAGTVTEAALNAAIDRGVADGRIDATASDPAVASLVNTAGSAVRGALSGLFTTKMPKTLNLREYGVQGANTVDNAAFLSAMTTARDSRRIAPNGLMSDPLGTVTIELPAGDIRISDLQGLMGAEATDVKIRGLRIKGQGINLTHVIFDPAEAGILAFNRYWQSIRFEGITFSTTKAGSTFMQSNAISGSAPQDFAFTDVQWSGPWKYILDLKGTNNNSEFRFIGCATVNMQAGGAWLYSNAVSGSDQFLNYWFYACKHQVTDAALIDMAKGGHIHMFGVDCSAWGNNLATPGYLLNLRGGPHSYGVMSFTAQGLRVEAKNNNAALLYSEWADGNIEIQVDWSSQVLGYTYGDIIHMNLGNVSGPILNVHDSFLAGGVKVTYGNAQWQRQARIRFQSCNWKQRLTPSEVVTYDESGAASNRTRPTVRFIDCRNPDAENGFGTTGASVWDCTIGYDRGALIKPLQKQSVVARGIYGSLRDTDGALKINLPVNALITGVRAVSSPAGVSDSDGASWSIATTEATPAVIATVTVSVALGTGYNVATERTVPYRCSTREKATITAYSTGAAVNAQEAFLVIEGYW